MKYIIMKCKTLFTTILSAICLVLATLVNTTQAVAQIKPTVNKPGEIDRSVIPLAEPKFEGVIGKTYKESKGEWPKLPAPPKGAPNVVVILLDDVGFGQVSTFGGPIPTPVLDKLATQGLRYTRFHTTAICGPSRAALITGRNHHNAGSGFLAEWATGFPSYNCMIPKSSATVAATLKGNGYATSWFGKNHNTPDWESSVAGPFDRWPTGMGFEYFYGFIGGEAHQYYPAIFENTKAVEPSKTPEEGYHLVADMTDKAINYMKYSKAVAPDKPLFMYFAPGAAHAPHHAPKEWSKKFKGKFDQGWEKVREETYQRQLKLGIIPSDTKLTPRPDWVPKWDTLSVDQKRLYLRLFENFAGYLAYTDHEVGRLIDAIHALPDADNTMIIYIVGDNGASSEGGPDGTLNEVKALNGFSTPMEENLKHIDEIGGPNGEPHYPVGWAWSGNAPFQWVKQVASHFGGTRNPMIISWPAKIKDAGGIRTQFTHLIDIVPTILEAANLPTPKTVDGVPQKPLDGVSFMSTFNDSNAKPVRTRQYFEVFSNRAIYDNGWIAAAQHTFPWRQDYAPGNWDNDKWELYNIDNDFSESNDLAASNPKKLAEMKALFDEEAKKNNVYPLDDRGTGRIYEAKPSPGGSDPTRKHFTYYAGAVRLAENAAPNTKNRSHTITADITIPEKGGDGVIVAEGGLGAGFAFYVLNGKLVYEYNWFDEDRYIVTSSENVPFGKSTVKYEFIYDGASIEDMAKGGKSILYINGKKVGEGHVEKTVPGRFGIDTFGIGEDTGSPVSKNYQPPFAFKGTINKVDFDLN